MSRFYLLCDSCGRKITNKEARKRWDGLVVCQNDWEPKHPALTYRVPTNTQGEGSAASRSGLVRPESTDTFVLTCTLVGTQAIPGLAIAGCMIPSKHTVFDSSDYDFCTRSGRLSRAGFAMVGCWTIGVFQ